VNRSGHTMIHSLVLCGFAGPRLQILLGVLVLVALLTVDFGANESLVLLRKRRLVHLISSKLPSLSENYLNDESRRQALHWMANSRANEISIWFGSADRYRIVQQYSLATFYFASNKLSKNATAANFTSKTSWVRSDGWLEEPDECKWYGVECMKDVLNDSDSNLVVGLNLSQNGLMGSIPLDLALLSDSLSVLDLISNRLTGKISSVLGNMSLLQSLHLDRNELTGSLPSHIGLLTHLQHLTASHNDFQFSLPTELGLLSKLQRLDFQKNSLLGPLPSELGLLTTSLKTLQLSHNNIFGQLPNSIERLRLLEWLDLSYNVLTGSLPSKLENLPNLSIMRLRNNFLKGEAGSNDARRKQTQQRIQEWDLSGNFFSDLPIDRDRLVPGASRSPRTQEKRERKITPDTCLE